MNLAASRVVVIFTALILAIPAAGWAESPHLGVEIGKPAVKIVNGPDSDSDLKISVKVTVTNTIKSELKVDLIIQALDREGFEVFDVFLSDAVKPGKTRDLSDTDYIQDRLYKSITVWRVEQATIRGRQ